MRQKTSVIWSCSKGELTEVVRKSKTTTEVLAHFGLCNIGGNYRTLRKRLDYEGIDYSHLPKGSGHNGIWLNREKRPLTEYLVKNTVFKKTRLLRNRLVAEGLMKEECVLCGQGSQWNGKALRLQLDHINGDRCDNRLENLRLLCPNCHSQTPTFAGRSLRVMTPCSQCGKGVGRKSKTCRACHGLKRRRTDRPPLAILQAQTEKLGFVGTGKLYGVSDNAIRKWMRSQTHS